MAPYRDNARVSETPPAEDDAHPEIVQTWRSERVCPICGVRLFAARQHGVRIDACGTCGGSWVTNATAQQMLASWVAASVASDLARKADFTATVAALPVGERHCPDCGEALERSNVSGIELDVCRKDGTWFDRRELARIIAHAVPNLEEEAAYGPSETRPNNTLEFVRWSANRWA